MTTIRLAHVPGAQGDNVLMGRKGVAQLPRESRPALLFAYPYIAKWRERQHLYAYRDWALDSGAFSVHSIGKSVSLSAYIDTAAALIASDPTLTDVFALDVIGNADQTIRNTEEMWRQGVRAIPCYHAGEPEAALLHMAAHYPKIAIGGVARKVERFKERWAKECFARVWPKRVHGFGFGTRRIIMAVPFHSVDATSWEFGPCARATWKTYGKMSLRGSAQNLRVEVEWYLKLEREARSRWAKEMELLEST